VLATFNLPNLPGILNIGPNAEGQAANTGVFQNRLAPSGNAIWLIGRHTLSFGASYTYTQLNTIDSAPARAPWPPTTSAR